VLQHWNDTHIAVEINQVKRIKPRTCHSWCPRMFCFVKKESWRSRFIWEL